MSWRTSLLPAALVCAAVTQPAVAQPVAIRPDQALHVAFPADSPVALKRAEWGQTTASIRGGLMQLDLKASLLLQNVGDRPIHGITLAVIAQEAATGGRAAVSAPSLHVLPGETFAIPVDLRLLRPAPQANQPLVEVGIDGVVFDNLAFYGPDRLHSRRTLTVWEQESRRDRARYKALLEKHGPQAIKEEMVASLGRQAEQSRNGVQVARLGRATAQEPERELKLAFIDVPGAPVELSEGYAKVAGGEMRYPQIAVQNKSDRPVKSVEIGWALRDREGRELTGGTTPSELNVGPYRTGLVRTGSLLRFTYPNGAAVPIEELTGVLGHVEFADGSVWVPDRGAIRDARVLRTLGPSPEEQRLSDLYRRKGLLAVIDELKRY